MNMSDNSWLEHITSLPNLHAGDPCIRGTRVPVSVIVGSVADGDTVDDILTAYPSLTAADIRAALKYAAEVVRDAGFLPLSG